METKELKHYPGKPYYLSKDEQERMVDRTGWTLELIDSHESNDEAYTRLLEKYEDVRIYWAATMVRGLHSYFAMCKGRKYNYSKVGE